MPPKKSTPPLDARASLEEMLAVSESINQGLLQAIADAAWSSPPPGGKGRCIAQLFAHIHNVRLMLAGRAKARRSSEETRRRDDHESVGAPGP